MDYANRISIGATARLSAQVISVETIKPNVGSRKCSALDSAPPAKLKSLGSKSGLSMFWIDEDKPTFLLRSGATTVGYLNLRKETFPGIKARYAVDSSFILPAHRGNKLGTVLYLGALHVLKHLASDALITEGAVGVWCSLEKFGYKVSLFSTTFDKLKDFTWGADGLPVVDGKSIERTKEEFIFYI